MEQRPLPKPDPARSEEVLAAVRKVMETREPNVYWMTPEFAHRINEIAEGTRTLMHAQMLMAGMPAHDAKGIAAQMAPMVQFVLGMYAQQELSETAALRDLFGSSDD